MRRTFINTIGVGNLCVPSPHRLLLAGTGLSMHEREFREHTPEHGFRSCWTLRGVCSLSPQERSDGAGLIRPRRHGDSGPLCLLAKPRPASGATASTDGATPTEVHAVPRGLWGGQTRLPPLPSLACMCVCVQTQGRLAGHAHAMRGVLTLSASQPYGDAAHSQHDNIR